MFSPVVWLSREQEAVPSVLDFVHYSAEARSTLKKLKVFIEEHVYPVELVMAVVGCMCSGSMCGSRFPESNLCIV